MKPHVWPWAAGKGAGTKVDPAAALWSYDTRDETWAVCTVSGELPAPELASAFTVIGDHAYLLVMDEIHDTGLTVYQLDLVLWTWHRLPPSDTPFFMDGSIGQDTIVTAVVEVHCPILVSVDLNGVALHAHHFIVTSSGTACFFCLVCTVCGQYCLLHAGQPVCFNQAMSLL